MKQRSSDNWRSQSGTWDAMKTRYIDFEEEFPLIGMDGYSPDGQSPIINCNDNKNLVPGCLVSMFVDDYILERFWNRPEHYINRFKPSGAVMSPDFSLLLGMPDPVQRFQVYRNRLVGYVWERAGCRVVPTVSWSDEKSYSFAFQGIRVGSTVAVSNIGCKTAKAKEFFDSGYLELIRAINPGKIIFMAYKGSRHLYEAENVIFIPSFFENRRLQSPKLRKWEAETENG